MSNEKIAVYKKRKNCKIMEICAKCGVELKYIRFRKLTAVNIEDMAVEKVNGGVLLCPLCWNKYQAFLNNDESYNMRASHDFNLATVDYMKKHGMLEDENIYSILSKKRSEELESESEVSERSNEAESN